MILDMGQGGISGSGIRNKTEAGCYGISLCRMIPVSLLFLKNITT